MSRSNWDGGWEKAGLEASPSRLNVVGGFFWGIVTQLRGGVVEAIEVDRIALVAVSRPALFDRLVSERKRDSQTTAYKPLHET